MFCPNCGQQNSIEQKFCRKCGLNLETSAASLAEQRERGDVGSSDRRLEMFGNIVFGGLGLVGLAGVAGMIYTVIVKFVLTGEGVAFGVIISLLLIFAVLAIAFVIVNEARKEKSGKISSRDPKATLAELDTAKLLQTGDFQPIPSVIEETTNLLPVENRTRKL